MIEIREVDGIYVAVITMLTEVVLRMFPKINRSRYGLAVSLVVGILLCVLDGYEAGFTIIQSILRGVIIAGLASGLFDGAKTMITWKGNKK